MRSIIKQAAFLLLSMLVINNVKAQAKEQLNITLSNPGKPFTVILRLDQGAVDISSYNGTTVQIEVVPITEKKEEGSGANQNRNQNNNANTNSNTNHGDRIAANKAETRGKYISVTESSNNVTITAINEKQKLAVIVKVPRHSGKFNLSSTLHTDITATNLNGEIVINNNAGNIVLKNITGSAIIANVAGSIQASFTNISENTPMAFSTVSGVIDVSFPASFKAEVKVNSDEGQLISDYELRAASGAVLPAIKRNSSGQYVAGTVKNISCNIGGGGPDIRFKNMVGNIYIRKNK